MVGFLFFVFHCWLPAFDTILLVMHSTEDFIWLIEFLFFFKIIYFCWFFFLQQFKQFSWVYFTHLIFIFFDYRYNYSFEFFVQNFFQVIFFIIIIMQFVFFWRKLFLFLVLFSFSYCYFFCCFFSGCLFFISFFKKQFIHSLWISQHIPISHSFPNPFVSTLHPCNLPPKIK